MAFGATNRSYDFKPDNWPNVFTSGIAAPGSRRLHGHLASAAASREMNIDGSGTAVPFNYSPGADNTAIISQVDIQITDAAGGTIKADNFGGLSALDKGVKLEIMNADGTTVDADISSNDPIKSNGDWVTVAGDRLFILAGAGVDLFAVDMDFERMGASLLLQNTEALRFTVQDDLTGLVKFHVHVHGIFYENYTYTVE